MNGTYIAYALVFLAATGVIYTLWKTTVEASTASSAKMDFENNLHADGRQKTPLERFISPGALFRQRVVGALVLGLLVPFAFFVAGFANPFFLLAFGGVFAFVGWHIPRLYWLSRVAKRQRLFEMEILDLATGLASALKAGMAFPQALERVSHRMTGPMAEELAILRREYRLGTEIADSFDRLVYRMPCEDMRLLAASVRLTGKTGGSLADVLSEMAEMIRGRRDFAEKVRTLTAQGRFEGMVLGAMPVIAFVIFYIIQPDLMMSLFRSVAGWTALGIAAVLEFIGFIVIGRLTKIEV
jgi:tight adherence protein B